MELKLINVSKIYKGKKKNEEVVAVKDFNLSINKKEFVVFVGPSGCGKSTTLRMIAGLEDISKGELYMDGELMNKVEPKFRNVAMVFQNYALYPHMTAYQNMAFGLKNMHIAKDEIDKRINQAVKILDIEHLLHRKPKAMSGGERQRVALGRAIVRTPRLFLLDEPLSNLDAKLRAQMRVEITKLYEKLDTPFIYVTHDQVEAMTMGTIIVVMRKGIIQQIDRPEALYDFPNNRFVAGFIGTPQMNFYEVTIKKIRQSLQIVLPENNVLLVALKDLKKIKDEYLDGQEHKAILGIRPEHIQIVENADKDTFQVETSICENLGSETLVYADFALGKDLNIRESTSSIVIKRYERDVFLTKQNIFIKFEKKKIHLFSNDEKEETIYKTEDGEMSNNDKPSLNVLSEEVIQETTK